MSFHFFVSPGPIVGTSPLNPTNIATHEQIHYVHSYHIDILEADLKNHFQQYLKTYSDHTAFAANSLIFIVLIITMQLPIIFST